MGIIKRLLIGAPLRTEQAAHERLTKTKALATFSSDALSSVAYATEEILLMLVLAGAGALSKALPIALGIVILLIVVAISYRQTIFAYPSGGGSYIVSKDNLGIYPGLVAGAALLIDYILTVAVSISAGVAAITSAFPALTPFTVVMCLFLIAGITVANLRGIRESAAIFSVPTYIFVAIMFIMVAVGLVRLMLGHESAHPSPHAIPPAVQPLTTFLILRAFASGCTALTGVEAISNGVPAFHPPESKNAAITLTWMATILIVLFSGITVLANAYGAVPSHHETVVSQVARHIFGNGLLYLLVQASTALILVLAANTSYADFPRLASLIARDGYLPRYLANRGDRLVYSNGVVVLGALAALLVVLFGGSTHHLIPLYAVGVFLSFTLSQLGMVIHWWKLREPGWTRNIAINALGAATTFVVLIVITVTKFLLGAWMVITLLPIVVYTFRAIHRHYVHLGRQLRLAPECKVPLPKQVRHRIVVPVSGVNNAVVNTLEYARSLSPDITAVHIAVDPEAGAKVKQRWEEWNKEIPLLVVESPYRSLTGPLIDFIEKLDAEDPYDLITILVPEFVTHRWWHYLLHQQTALLLRTMLMFRKRWVVTGVPYHVEP
ncbi:MAG TPA: APC family permease [Symbiobacteriaceae bacterium]|jgi:amino acid transporter|nr:APC family permease [Symbiobacteriaceae bacterium]